MKAPLLQVVAEPSSLSLLAGLMSLLVWLVQNYGTVERVGLLLALMGSLALASTIAAIIVRLYRCFKILEAL